MPFEQKDPSVDEQAREELIALGISATPVTVIDGESVVGFDPQNLDRLLNA